MIIFGGGCHGCTQQEKHGIDFCYDCCFFDADYSKPSLRNMEISARAGTERQKVIERRKIRDELRDKLKDLLPDTKRDSASFVTVNLNCYVYVRLTDAGRVDLSSQGIDAPIEDPNGYGRWQLWQLMHAFGSRLFLGCHAPFDEMTIKLPLGELVTLSSS
jgi:hypothetical protein